MNKKRIILILIACLFLFTGAYLIIINGGWSLFLGIFAWSVGRRLTLILNFKNIWDIYIK